jgi:hypothetical protein
MDNIENILLISGLDKDKASVLERKCKTQAQVLKNRNTQVRLRERCQSQERNTKIKCLYAYNIVFQIKKAAK